MSDSLAAVRFMELIRVARSRNASDVHILPGLPAALRVDGCLEYFGSPISSHHCKLIAQALMDEVACTALSEHGDVSIAHRDAELGSFRIHGYRGSAGMHFAIRLLSLGIPTLESLHLPTAVSLFAHRQSGLILFGGPTGSGKTTALAALIDRINRHEAKHIITIEDPVEYEHVSRKSIVSQREVGRDVPTFAHALTAALRADPDVILVGELRDGPTMQAALGAAETGHLVFATLHTGDAPQTIDRIIDAFPSEAQMQVRVQLAAALVAVVCLRLAPRLNGPGRRAAAEVLLANDAVRNLIRDQKTHQIRNVLATSRQAGMQTLESHLSELVMRREISFEAAQALTDRPSEIRALERSAV